MNIVNFGTTYRVYGEDLKTFTELPAQTYTVGFSKMSGFFLESHHDLDTNEIKVYGNHEARVRKALKSFALSNRNFGVILSGHKGIGKSLLVRMMANEAIKQNMPVIIVDQAIPGIANFLSSIEQEVMIVFDEFEKTFAQLEDEADPQVELLSLFDGIDGGKKLFVITCNSTKKLNEFFVNRPGRFHYHFEIGFPTAEEISEYLHDKLLDGFDDEIEKVAKLGSITNLTYDCLRAIAFDLAQGYPLEETLADLNINHESGVRFDVTIRFDDGRAMTTYSQSISIYGHENKTLAFREGTNTWFATFNTDTIQRSDNVLFVNGKDISFRGAWDNYNSEMSDDDAEKKREEDRKNLKPKILVLNKVPEYDVEKYAV